MRRVPRPYGGSLRPALGQVWITTVQDVQARWEPQAVERGSMGLVVLLRVAATRKVVV